MIAELSHQEIPAINCGVAQERIRRSLHSLLTFYDTLSFMFDRRQLSKMWRVTGRQFFFNLQDQRIPNTIGKKEDHIITRSYASCPHDLKRHIGRHVGLQYPLMVNGYRVAVRTQRFSICFRVFVSTCRNTGGRS